MKQVLHSLCWLGTALSNTRTTKQLPFTFFSTIQVALRYLLIVMALGFSATALISQTIWTGNTNSNWNTPGNWMPAVVPTATDDVIIPNTANDPIISGAPAAVAKSVTIQSGAILTIQSMGSLSVEGGSGMMNFAIYNVGTVSNSGTITIGATVSPGFYGIQNLSTFTNQAGGNITINRGSIGIRNEVGASFTNGGTLKIGNVANLNNTGVYNEADFQNLATGVLEISRTNGSGFYNLATGTLTNAGTITLGKDASISGAGFYNFNEIENQAGATINIDRTNTAIDNQPNTSFTNEGLIVIGANFNVSGSSIYNQAGATFLNTDGEIRIDGFNSAAIDNRVNSIFTTTGLIIIGGNAVAGFGGPGIYNYGGTFTNDGGEIRIDRVGISGINNTYATTFVSPNIVYTAGSFSNLNDGIITIGANAATALGGPGIFNDSPFNGSVISTFLNEGTISINRTTFGIHNNYQSSFTNAGDITIGDVAINIAFGGPGITNYGTFMHNAGTIQIDRTASGIHNQPPFNGTGSFTNAATIIIGSISDMTNGPGITNIGTFNNNTGGNISIDRVANTNTNTSAVWNSNGSAVVFNNNGVLKIGTLATIGNIGITVENSSTFNNLADGEITIERTARQGIFINSIFNNQGKIDIGLTTNIGERGIAVSSNNAVLFKNEGEVTIDRASIHGIYHNGGTIENSGKIDIGKTIGIGNFGIYSQSTFNNLAAGEINIDRANITGLRHDNGTFTNAGKLNLGSIASIGSWGFWNQATFNNNVTGEIHVNRTTMTGMINNANTFTNFGELYIGDLAAVGDHAIYNAAVATLRNEACALIAIYAPLNNLGTLIQSGLFRVNTLVAHTNTPGFTNNGVIEYAQINPIPNVTNNDIIIEPIDGLCPTDVIQIGGMNSFSIATTWYQDEALTMPAGTYDAMANTFTPAGLSAGTHTLYFEITDNVNTCTQIASIQITTFSMGILYVDEDATGANNGTSWTDAYNDLQDALAAACTCGSGQIWVADGTYYPDEGVGQTNDDRASTFQLCNGVAVYGGFSGWSGGTSGGSDETTLNQRDVFTNIATLSGDIDQDDMPNFVNNTNNAYHVVTGSGTDMTARIDGFTITAGKADGGGVNDLGGGMYNDSGSPTVANCTFSGNSANAGGGMYNLANISPSIINCSFSGNAAQQDGGGMYNRGSSPSITNSIFSGNIANRDGGGMYNYFQIPIITNCTFSGNMANRDGGGMYNDNSSPSLTNTIIWNNRDKTGIGTATSSIFRGFFGPNISFSLIANSGGSSSWNAAIGIDGGNNKDEDPDFVTPIDFTITPPPTTAGDLRLLPSSPAINMGNNAAVPADSKDVDDDGNTTEPTPDLDLNERIFNDALDIVDMGAFESQCVNPTGIFSISDATICEGEEAFLQFEASVGTAPFTITFGGGNINPGTTTQTVGNGNPFWTLNTDWYNTGVNIYTITQIEDANGCVTVLNEQLTLTVNPLPTGTFTLSDATICEGEEAFLQFEASVGTAPFTITFGGGNINPGTTTQTAGNGNPFWTLNTDWYNEGINIYTITQIEDANGCVTVLNEQLTLTVNPLPTGTFTLSDATICEGEEAFLQFEASVGTPPFTITFGGGNINPGTTTQTAGNGNPFWTLNTDWYNEGINIYTITQIEDANGCVTVLNEQLTLTVNPLPTGTIQGDTVCQGEDAFLFFTGTGTAPFFVIIDGLNSNQEIMAGAGNGNPIWTFVGGQSLSIGANTFNLLSVRDNNGCTITGDPIDNAVIVINGVDAGAIASDQTICSGDDPAAFTSTTDGSGSGAITYRWESSTTSCATGFTTIQGATSSTYDAPVLTSTTYYRRITISTFATVACEDTSNCVTITVNQITPGEIGGSQTVCTTKDPAPFTSITPATGSGTITYQWESSTTSCETDFTSIDGATAETFDPAKGQFSVTTYFRRRATSTLNGVACDAISNCVTLTVLNVDCGQFPWNGN